MLASKAWLAKMADADYEGLCALIETPVPRRSPASESQGADRELSQSA
jgi:hypothetical protein